MYGNNFYNGFNPNDPRVQQMRQQQMQQQMQQRFNQPMQQGFNQPYQQSVYNRPIQQQIQQGFNQPYQKPIQPNYQQPMYGQPVQPGFNQPMQQQPLQQGFGQVSNQNRSNIQITDTEPVIGLIDSVNTNNNVVQPQQQQFNQQQNINQQVKVEENKCDPIPSDGHEFMPYYDKDTEKLKKIVDNRDCTYIWKIIKK